MLIWKRRTILKMKYASEGEISVCIPLNFAYYYQYSLRKYIEQIDIRIYN